MSESLRDSTSKHPAREPLSASDFAIAMARLGPFEARPRLAVAVSGGPDSMALALLCAGWAADRGGEVVGLTVDHRLRPESSTEAARVAAWLAARGIRHLTLTWDGPKPVSDLQAAARAARHGLLGEFCRAQGILHLAFAHHLEDQAETLLLRLGRGSGVDGLAAMAETAPTRWGRLIRPVLAVPRGCLAATLGEAGQEWIEDPSNQCSDFARVRLRRLGPLLAAEGMTPQRLAATAARMGRARRALEDAVAEAAARWVELAPGGFAHLPLEAFGHLADEVALRLLVRLVLAVGGGEYPPRAERAEGLLAGLRQGLAGARTLGGCRFQAGAGQLLVCREAARMAPPVALVPGAAVVWDGRFRAELASDAPAGLRLGALGAMGWRRVAADKGRALPVIPAAARATLPAVFDEDGVSAVPHLGYNRGKADSLPLPLRLAAAPAFPLTASGARLV